MKTTKQILKDFNISRQTLMNWINTKAITTPSKDWRGWYIWSEKNLEELEKLMSDKREANIKVSKGNFDEELNIYNRRYLGSKKRLLSFIEEVVNKHTNNINTVADVFGGTGVVSDLFRNKGKKIIINDILKSNYVTYLTWFSNDPVDEDKIRRYIDYLNTLKPIDNYVSDNFGDRYFSIDNAKKIGTIREAIEDLEDLNGREKAFLLTSLIYAMDKVANTVGHYDAHIEKRWI
ncbi:DNA adenine methylase [Staphylococcus sp. EZ-P03]|uniref:DNA adenine methylase n=1 Tax=Staphylococcus sp. EZ-P03 TaxID=2282739 RepID=UPI0019699DA3|nr:DNA adenine methylase [Staphylococcus sp. EZ-P03]